MTSSPSLNGTAATSNRADSTGRPTAQCPALDCCHALGHHAAEPAAQRAPSISRHGRNSPTVFAPCQCARMSPAVPERGPALLAPTVSR